MWKKILKLRFITPRYTTYMYKPPTRFAAHHPANFPDREEISSKTNNIFSFIFIEYVGHSNGRMHGGEGKPSNNNNTINSNNSISATVLFEYLEYLKLKGPWDRRLTLIEFVNSFSINEPFLGDGCWRCVCLCVLFASSSSLLSLSNP